MEKLKQRMVELIGNDDGIWLFDKISVILDENNVSENSNEKFVKFYQKLMKTQKIQILMIFYY